MTRRMLINAQSPEELRIAVVDNSSLETYQVEVAETGLTRGNIYRGLISNIQPSLNAAFIDYGAERHGFLAIQDVVPDAYYRQPKGKPRIEEVLQQGRPIVVQVTREPEAQKGAALTTNLSLAGRYLVLTPFGDHRGVSRKVENDDDRKRLRAQVAKLDVPKGCGVIVRTNALDQTKAALSRDLAALLRLWKRVESDARKGKGTRLLYTDQDLILQALRDYLDSSVEEVLVDDDDAFEKAEQYLRAFMPRSKTRLVRYRERAPLFSKFSLESQIDRIYQRSVDLPGGGSIVIDRTEALTAVDVNSGRATRAASQEETALATNLEAAREVARQLRLRDIGGLIVVDFIDMRAMKGRRKVEKALREAMKDDKARVQIGRLSSNGLLEINRQRLQQALLLRTHRPCPTCAGTGRIASPEMVGLNLVRRIHARAATGTLQKVRIGLHPELADSFQNQRRQEIAALEQEFEIKVEVVSTNHLDRPEQEVDWFSRPQSAAPAAGPTASAPLPAPVFRSPAEGPTPVKGEPAAGQGGPARAAAKDRSEEKKPGEGPPRPSRRRRRRRGGKAAADGAAKTQEKAPSAAPKKATEEAGGKANASGDAPARTTRKRPRRRARRKGGGEASRPAS